MNTLLHPTHTAIIAHTTKKTSSYFMNKDKIPVDLQSNVVYKFTCDQCDHIYIGETTRHFTSRQKEHLSGKPEPSVISLHDHQPKQENFQLLFRTSYPTIGEAVAYKQEDPQKLMNRYQPPFKLQLFNFSSSS